MLLHDAACHDEVAFGTKAKLPYHGEGTAKHHVRLPPSYYHYTIFIQWPFTRPLTALTTIPIVTTDDKQRPRG